MKREFVHLHYYVHLTTMCTWCAVRAVYFLAPAFLNNAAPLAQPAFFASAKGVLPSLLVKVTLAPLTNKDDMTFVLQKIADHIKGVLPVTPASSIGMAAFSTKTSATAVESSKIAVTRAL